MSTSRSDPAAQARRALGARLRELRKEVGLTARALASATGQHFTRVSKIENGVQEPTERDLREWCRICDADSQVPDLLATLRSLESAYLEYRRQSKAGMKSVLGAHTLARYERTKFFRIYEHNVVPGLFQTAEYAAAMLSFWIGFLGTPNDLPTAVAARMDRQRVLHCGSKRFFVLLEEQALRTWFGDAGTQARQLDRLLALMRLPNVVIGVIPLMTERVAVGSAGFWMFDDDLVALETPTASIEVDRPDECRLYGRMFEALRASAVFGKDARELIGKTVDELGSPRV